MPNYEKLWQEIGVDMERHEEFRQSMKSAFADTYLTQEKRPENMEYWDDMAEEPHGKRLEELLAHQASGEKVFASSCAFVPEEIVWATKGIVVGFCGGAHFPMKADASPLAKTICPRIRSSVMSRIDRSSPISCIADMYLGVATCDGKRKAWNMLKEDVRTHIMNLPLEKNGALSKCVDEVATFTRVVEIYTDNQLSVPKLNDACRVYNEKRKALARIYEARKNEKLPISGRDALLVMQLSFMDDPVRCAEMCNKLADELDQRIADGVSLFPEGTKRILVTGTPMVMPNWKLHHIVENCGGVVVCEEMCTGNRYFEHLVREDNQCFEDVFVAVAERYMNINCACFTPNDGRIDDIIRLCREYKVDGVIDVSLSACGLYGTESYAVHKALAEAGIPMINIDTDYNEADFGELQAEVTAFINSL